MQRSGWTLGLAGLVLLATGLGRAWAEAPAAAVTGFESYVGAVEGRLTADHRTDAGFLAGVAASEQGRARLRQGSAVIEELPTPEVPGALLHDWRGTAFAAGAKAEDFGRMLRDFDAYPRYFAPQVLAARTTAADGDRVEGWMRVRQTHLITVVLDTTYDVRFGRLDARDGWSAARSTRVAEVEDAGTPEERELGFTAEHGFLWRMNTYWSWQEADGGLYVQVESVSLTRGIPAGLGWAVGPFVESIPRESLAFTLQAACAALRGGGTSMTAGRKGERGEE